MSHARISDHLGHKFEGLHQAATHVPDAAVAHPPVHVRDAGLPQRLVIEAKQLTRQDRTHKRHKRIRNKVRLARCRIALQSCTFPTYGQPPTERPTTPQVDGDQERPRLAVYRSNQHIYAQVCAGQTAMLCAHSQAYDA